MCPNDAAELTSAFFMYMFHIFFYFSDEKKAVNFAHVLLGYVWVPKELRDYKKLIKSSKNLALNFFF